ncbi:hypothetical protein JCM10213v2_009009 [Rhodosporidiobolus nylandii]
MPAAAATRDAVEGFVSAAPSERTLRSAAKTVDYAGEGEEEEKEVEKPAKQKKKRKTGKAKAKSTSSSGPDSFSSLPADILHCICGYLRPSDLLSLAKVSKGLHATLISPTNSALWRAARRSVAMPDLDAEIAEVEYARLVEGEACEVCGSTKKKTQFDHDVRVRCCSRCLQKNLRTEAYITKKHEGLHDKVFEYSAAGDTRTDQAHYFYLPSVFALSTQLFALDSALPVEVLDEDENQTGVTVDAVSAFCEERKKLKEAVARDAKEIFEYQSRSLDESFVLMDEKKKQRKKDIYHKLDELGYDKRDYESFQHLYHSGNIYALFDSYKPLSNAEWGRIRKTLLAAVDQNKSRRLAHERLAAQQVRKTDLQPLHAAIRSSLPAGSEARATFPPSTSAAWLNLPGVKALWEEEQDGAGGSWSPEAKQKILEQAKARAWETKVEYASKVTRALLKEGGADFLPDAVAHAVKQEADALVWSTSHLSSPRVLAPLHAALSAADVDAVLSPALASFCCSYCGRLAPYTETVQHIYRGVHGLHPEVPYALQVPPEGWRKAVKGMLRSAGLAQGTACGQLEGMGNVFEATWKETAWRDEMEIKKGLGWKDVTAGSGGHYSWLRTGFRAQDVVALKIVRPPSSAAPSSSGLSASGSGQAGGSAKVDG